MDINDFAKAFPQATYRIVHADSKSPIDSLVYDLEEAVKTIAARGREERLGWMVDSEHIVIDVDCDPETDPGRDKAVRVFKTIKNSGAKTFLYTTEHGMHCIFRLGDYKVKGITKVMCGLGVRVDVRVQGNYVILPYNDPKRNWWKGSCLGPLDEIPPFMRIISKSKNLAELWGMDEGDGRNDAMFRFLQALKSSQMAQLSLDDVKQCVLLCNGFILKTPIGDRELYSTILRPENMVANKAKDSASIDSEYAIRINNENDIIYANDTFFMIQDDTNIYRQMTDEEMDRFIYIKYTKDLDSKHRKEIRVALGHEAYCGWDECNRDPYDIPFSNGIYNVKAGAFRQTSPGDNLTYCLPHKYNPDMRCTPNVDSFYSVSLEHAHDKQVFFSQMLGYCMTRSAEFQVFFIFKGRGGTGKSTMLEIIANILGKDNISNLQLEDFNKEFGLETMFNKLANLGDDISGTKLTDSQSFKKASSGDVINVNRKYKTALVYAPFAKIIFTSNPYPKIADKSRAMERRMRIVSSDHVIQKDEIVPNFVKNLTEDDYAAIINDALKEFHALLENGAKTFPDPEESKGMKERLRLLGDHVYSFVKSSFPEGTDVKRCLDGETVLAQFQRFVNYCKDRNYQPSSLDTFKEQICENLEYTIEEDRMVEIFKVKKEEEE